MWPLLISCLCLQLGETLMALVNKKPRSGSSQYPSPCVDHIPKNSLSTSLRGRWASATVWQLSALIRYELHCVPVCFLTTDVSRLTCWAIHQTLVPANFHSDGQPCSASTLPLLINTFITRWTEHKITLWLGRANRKQTAVWQLCLARHSGTDCLKELYSLFKRTSIQ